MNVRVGWIIWCLLLVVSSATLLAQEQTPSEESALKAYRQGSFSRAVKLYTQALSETDDAHHRAELHVRIAWTLFALGREDEVPTHVRAALLEDPGLTLVPDYYTQEFLDLFEAIRKAPSPVQAEGPRDILAPDLEATVAAVEQRVAAGADLEGALADVELLLQAYPSDGRLVPLKVSILEKLGRTDEALALSQRAGGGPISGAFGGESGTYALSVPELILRANRLLDEGDIETSLQILRQAVGRQPSNVAALELLAEAARRAGQWQEAEYALKSALALQQDNLELQLRLGEVYLAMGDQSAARDVFRQLTEKHPHSDRAWAALGLLDAGLLRKDRAMSELATALQENPLLPEVQLAYGELLLGVGKAKEALEALRSASNLLQDDPQVEARVGQALLAMGGSAEHALDELKTAVQGGFTPPDVQAATALALIVTGRLSEAERTLGNANLDAGHGGELLKGLLAYHKGDFEGALTRLREEARRRPNDPAVLNMVGATLYREQRYAEAVPLLERSHELSPNDPVIKANLRRAREAAVADELRADALPVRPQPAS